MTNETIAKSVSEFVVAKYRFAGASLSGDQIVIRNAKGQKCGTITVGAQVQVEPVYAGKQNLLGALAKQQIRAHVESMIAAAMGLEVL
jgi:hypothetical protein